MRQQAAPGAPAERSGTFGTWLRHERRRLDLTQSELAHLSGCASITLKKIEADQLRPSKSLAGSLARSLQIPSGAEAEFIHFARMGQAPTGLTSGQSGPAWYVRRWRDT